MIGSLPVSLNELLLAPAIISSQIKKKGHEFEFIDINLELFDFVGRDMQRYVAMTNNLTSFYHDIHDEIIDWFEKIMHKISVNDTLLVNVFSRLSQSCAYRFITAVRSRFPNIRVLVGGIGSQKLMGTSTTVFGQYLMDHGLADAWQTDTTTDEIDRMIPSLPTVKRDVHDFDFSIFDFDRYDWPRGERSVPMVGSYGCVRQCSFCDVIVHFPKYSFIEADQLTKNIVNVHETTGVSKVIFMDSLVNGSLTNFKNFLLNLGHAINQGWLPKDFRWSGTYICRARSTMLDEIHQLLAQSGVENLVIGVESGSDRVRFEMEKKFTNDDLLYEIESFHRHGVKTSLLFFPAWPTETLQDLEQTCKLYQRLSIFAQSGTIENISLGSTGFGLIDGSPIDQNRDKFGIEPGPANFLWRCHQNPDLNFWESIRRRMFLAELALNLGFRLEDESRYLNYLIFHLEEYADMISQFVGPVDRDIFDHETLTQYLPAHHDLEFTVINSGNDPVTLELWQNQSLTDVKICQPGQTKINWALFKKYLDRYQFEMRICFSSTHQIHWDRHAGGEYYNLCGVYVDDIRIDQRNITLWGWNQIMQQSIVDNRSLPADFHDVKNLRCIPCDSILHFAAEENCTLQKWLITKLYPDDSEKFLVQLKSKLYQHDTQNNFNLS